MSAAPMDQAYWARLKALFHELYDASSTEREQRLGQLRDTEPQLFLDVSTLFEEDERASRRDWWPVGQDTRLAADFQGNERFELLARIGSGGFGVVHRAYDRRDQRIVALKVLHANAPAPLLAFKQEFRSVADQRHPNLVGVHELFINGNHAFFTMDLIEGKPISEYLARHQLATSLGVPFLRTIGEVFGQLSRGLLALHRAGVLHRDLKPSNVLVTPEGRVVILDFGLAAAIDRDFHQRWGTPEYMAPELFTAAPATTSSDWYSFGLLLYECLTGVHPRRSRDTPSQFPPSVARSTVQARPSSMLDVPLSERGRCPSRRIGGVPEELDRLCGALLDPDPLRRPGVDVILTLFKDSTPETPGGSSSSRAALPFRPFIGREEEIAQLGSGFERARGSHPVVVRVHGRSGYGKTALVQEFLDQLAIRVPETLILRGRCHERENLGFRVFDGIVDELVRHVCQFGPDALRSWLPRYSVELSTLFPAFAAVTERGFATFASHSESCTPTEQRLRAFSALRELLGRLGKERPLVVFVDDLQWGDADSEPLLRHLLRHGDVPLLLVVAYRDEDLGSDRLDNLIAALHSAKDAVDVAVEGLGGSEVQRLLELHLGVGDPLISTVLASREGAPLLLNWLVDEVKMGAGQPEALPGTLVFESLFRRAVARLSSDARRLLSLLAVGSRPLLRDVVRDALGVTREVASNAEDSLRAKRMVRLGAQDTLEPAHDRLRQALVENLSAHERRGLHAALLDAMAPAGDLEALAFHAIGAERKEQARTYCIAAGRQCESTLAFDRAATHYQRALLTHLEPPMLEAEIRLRLAEVTANSGRGREAAEQYLLAAAILGERRLELQLMAGQQLMRSGEVVRGRRLLVELLSQRGVVVPKSRWWLGWQMLVLRIKLHLTKIPKRVAARVVAPEARLILDTLWPLASGLALVDTLGSVYFQTRHLAVALGTGDVPALIRALSLEAVLASVEGRRSRRRSAALLQLLENYVEVEAQPHSTAMIQLAKGIVAWMRGDFLECLAMTTQAEAKLRQVTGQSFELATIRAFALASLIWLGRLQEHGARFERLHEDATLRSDLHAQSSLVLLAHAHVSWVAQDDAPRARELVCRTLAAWPVQREFSLQHVWAWFALVEIALYEGNVELAVATVQRDWSKVRKSAHMRIGPIRIWMNQLRARVALAEVALLRRTDPTKVTHSGRRCRTLLLLVDELRRGLEREELALGHALGALTAGLVAGARDEHAAAFQAYQRAIEAFAGLDMRLHAGAARWAAAPLDAKSANSNRDAIEREFITMSVKSPEPFMAMLVPGA